MNNIAIFLTGLMMGLICGSIFTMVIFLEEEKRNK